MLATEVEAAAFRGWFAASPSLWAATAPLSEPLAGTAVIAFVQPVGCDTIGGAVLEVREGRYALGLRDVVRHQECLVAHQAVAAFRVPAPAHPDPPPALGPGGDPPSTSETSGTPSATEIDSPDDLAGDRYDDVRETVASRLTAGTACSRTSSTAATAYGRCSSSIRPPCASRPAPAACRTWRCSRCPTGSCRRAPGPPRGSGGTAGTRR